MISKTITIEDSTVASYLTEHTSDYFSTDIEAAGRTGHGLYSIDDERDHLKIANLLNIIVDGPETYDYRCTAARYIKERSISKKNLLAILSEEIKSCDAISSITGRRIRKTFDASTGTVINCAPPFYTYTLFYLQDEDKNRLPEFANLLLSPESDVRGLAEILYKRLSVRL